VRRLSAAAVPALALLAAPLGGGPPAQSGGGAGRRAAAAPAAPPRLAAVVTDSRPTGSVRDFWSISSSPARLSREDELAASWQARIDALDFETLDQAGRVDWLLLRTDIGHGLRAREARRAKLAETAELLPFAATAIALEEARWQLAEVDPEQAAGTLDALAKTIGEVRKSRPGPRAGGRGPAGRGGGRQRARQPPPPLPPPRRRAPRGREDGLRARPGT
jgi:hypothetical protein